MLLVLVAVCLAGYGYIKSGVYPIGADVPHSSLATWIVRTTSHTAIRRQSRSVKVPANLEDSTLIVKGAGEYAAMCSSCHLAPGFDTGELRQTMYPRPPRFTKGTDMSPGAFFWETKHGVKDTGMPAWGKVHSDDDLWAIVAFVEHVGKVKMTAEQYREIVARAPGDDDATRLPMPGSAGPEPAKRAEAGGR